MLKVKSDFDQVKVEMKEHGLKLKQTSLLIKKKYRRDYRIPEKDKNTLNSLAFQIDLYKASKTLPVRVEGIVINYKLYSSFIKKIKDYKTSILVQPDGVVVNYWKSGTLNQGKGVLKLYDLSQYFKDFEHVPEAILIES